MADFITRYAGFARSPLLPVTAVRCAGSARRTCAVAKGLTAGRTVAGRAAGLRPERIDRREVPRTASDTTSPPPSSQPVKKLNMRPLRRPPQPVRPLAQYTIVPSPPTTILLFTHATVYYNIWVFRNSKYNKSMMNYINFFFFLLRSVSIICENFSEP